MTCCGSRRSGTAGQEGRASSAVLFEYQGAGSLTLFGRMTGIRYHFPGPGARVLVDARDAAPLGIVRGLAIVEPGGREI